jgi:cholesterol transport system auxiliary component
MSARLRAFVRDGRVKSAYSVIAVSLLAMGLSGCALLGGGTPELDTYVLSVSNTPQAPGRSRMQVLIAQPSAIQALDGQNIVVSPGPGTVEFLGGAQWADRLPVIVQSELVQAFQRSGAFAGVGRPGEGLAIDYQVISEIRSFQIDAGGGVARVEIFVRLLNDRNGVVRASRTFTATSAVAGEGAPAFVTALDNAFGQVANEIVAWTRSTL